MGWGSVQAVGMAHGAAGGFCNTVSWRSDQPRTDAVVGVGLIFRVAMGSDVPHGRSRKPGSTRKSRQTVPDALDACKPGGTREGPA